MTEESLFTAALDVADPAERRAFLDEACHGDAGLRARVERLLASDRRSHGMLDHGPDTPVWGAPRPTSVLAAGRVFAGRFLLREKLGEGGMGEVWVADQTEPVRRPVAVKVIRSGLDSARLLARFEQERQALAAMDHPNIARVLDAGVWSPSPLEGEGLGVRGSVPYFVMEFIQGVPLTQFCDEARLSLRDRLELFIPVCQAVQHAHQKGVIHRDLKPSNILVTVYDGKPVPKVIDFGVAKATGMRLTEQSVNTEVGTLVGTPEYMSPEQAELNNPDIDTRTDVYALGVVLYELLTGGVPFPRREMGGRPLLEVLQVIRGQEPTKPSAKLSTAEDRRAVAENRGTDATRLAAFLRGELDWVVMKCLEKDRSRRYETANGLARDIQRFLSNEVVEARPPSAGYRLRKFVSRNRGRVAAAAVVLVALVAGVVGTSLGLVEARRERARANDEAAVTREVNDLLTTALLRNADPLARSRAGYAPDPNLKVRTLLDEAAARLDGRFEGRPKVEAAIRLTVGKAYSELGLYPQSVRHLERALALTRQTSPLATDECVEVGTALATAYRRGGQFPAAERLNREFLEALEAVHGPDHPHVHTFSYNLGLVCLNLEQVDEAERHLTRALAGRERSSGADSFPVAEVRNSLGGMFKRKGDYAKALDYQSQALAVYRRELTDDSPATLIVSHNVASCLGQLGRHSEARDEFVRLVAKARQVLGPRHVDTLSYIHELAYCHLDLKDSALAESHWQEAVAGARAELPAGHQDTILYAYNLGCLYEDLSRYADAERELSDALRHSRKTYPAGHPKTVNIIQHLIDVRFADRRAKDAEPLVRELLDLNKGRPNHWVVFHLRGLLGRAAFEQGRHTDAELDLLAGYRGLVERQATLPPALRHKPAELADLLIQLYLRRANPIEVAKWRAERAKYPPERLPPPRPIR
jgi:non-specific serine/threonine protein kinase/serine/threonine-protein kinase